MSFASWVAIALVFGLLWGTWMALVLRFHGPKRQRGARYPEPFDHPNCRCSIPSPMGWTPEKVPPAPPSKINDVEAELRAIIVVLDAENADWQQSFDLYDKAMRRGTKIWQEATGNTHVWPDAAALTAWLLERLYPSRHVVIEDSVHCDDWNRDISGDPSQGGRLELDLGGLEANDILTLKVKVMDEGFELQDCFITRVGPNCGTVIHISNDDPDETFVRF